MTPFIKKSIGQKIDHITFNLDFTRQEKETSFHLITNAKLTYGEASEIMNLFQNVIDEIKNK